jgi:hypothetical protein
MDSETEPDETNTFDIGIQKCWACEKESDDGRPVKDMHPLLQYV